MAHVSLDGPPFWGDSHGCVCVWLFLGEPLVVCVVFSLQKGSQATGLSRAQSCTGEKKKKEARAISRCTADFNTNPPWRRVSCYSVARGVGPLGVSLPRHVRRQLPRLGVRKCEAGLQGDGGRWLGRVQVAKYGSVFFGGYPLFWLV